MKHYWQHETSRSTLSHFIYDQDTFMGGWSQYVGLYHFSTKEVVAYFKNSHRDVVRIEMHDPLTRRVVIATILTRTYFAIPLLLLTFLNCRATRRATLELLS